MKAFLLAAGLGTRLKPLTDHIPKCLVPIGNTPLLGLWLTRLQACGVNEVLINTHHLPEKVNAFVGEYLKNAPEPGLSVTLCHELHLLGSAGTLLENRNFVKEEEVFLIVYADNLCDYDLTLLAAAQRENGKKGGLLTMALFEAPNPSACGIATLNEEGRITAFTEKPQNPSSCLANAGIYASGVAFMDRLEAHVCSPPYDLGLHVLPRMTEELFGLPMEGYLRDIGTPEALKTAVREWPLLKRSFHGF